MITEILYVDDEPDLREVAQMALELDPELTVTSCGSGSEALKIVGRKSFDLILLDVMMPGMDGPTTLARLMEITEFETPVVFITARASSDEARDLLSLGAKGVIAKPFDPLKLAAQVKVHANGR